jgi:hypothetical protein
MFSCTCPIGVTGTRCETAVDCGILPHPSNGMRNGMATIYNSTVQFDCDTGYNLTGSSTRTCRADGTWSGQQAHCNIVDCGDPGIPLHGASDLADNVTTYGTEVNFTCDPTHRLVGLSSIVCKADGYWSEAIPVETSLYAEIPVILLHVSMVVHVSHFLQFVAPQMIRVVIALLILMDIGVKYL